MDKQDVVELLQALDIEKTKSLTLSNKGITEIPEEISRFVNLEQIDFSFNNISEIPDCVWSFKKLKKLLLFRNDIESISPKIGKLKGLTLFDISYNQISEIPKEIGDLTELENLDLSYNKLQKVPIELTQLLHLKKLYLENNPLEFPPQRVVKRGLYSTMIYLTEEKKRRDATKVVLQVYNMPELIQTAFRHYINCFNDIVSAANKEEVKFDVNYINQDLTANIELGLDVGNYLNNFLKFVQENIGSLKENSMNDLKLNLLDLQVLDLKTELETLNETLGDKVTEIQALQNKVNHISGLLKNIK